MPDKYTIIRARQLTIRRAIDRRSLSLKAIAIDADIPYPTMLSYFPADGEREPACIPGAAIFALCGALPADLLSLLLPDGWQIVRAPEAVDHDELARLALDLATEHAAARHPASEAGVDIGPNEHNRLTAKAVQLKAVA